MEGANPKFKNHSCLSSQGNFKFGSSGFSTGTVNGNDIWGPAPERKPSLSSISWAKGSNPVSMNEDPSSHPISLLKGEMPDGFRHFLGTEEANATFFSSSLPTFFQNKLSLSSSIGHSVDMETPHLHNELRNQQLISLEEMDAVAIGDLLPDDEEALLSGIADSFDVLRSSSNLEEPEDIDLFSSGGGLEMDNESAEERFGMCMENPLKHDSLPGSIATHPGSFNVTASVIGEHPYGEHPSRTLFVRNINSNTLDSELRALFEQYGDIRTMYTACKHRGFVMISYYDIRDARTAMRALQNKPLRRRKLDIHFSIPKNNPSDKDMNQGTLVAFNLDASVSNDELRTLFSAYGEVKEIRETPHKRHHKFIEFYDVRAAEAALKDLNRTDIGGKRIKLEPSRPGGARRGLMQQLGQELEQDEACAYRRQASLMVNNSPPGQLTQWGKMGSPIQNRSMWGLHHSAGPGTFIRGVSTGLTRIYQDHSFPHRAFGQVGNIGAHLECHNGFIEGSHSPGVGSSTTTLGVSQHPHSFPEYSNGIMPVFPSGSVQDGSILQGVDKPHLPRVENTAGNGTSISHHMHGAVGMPTNGSVAHCTSGFGGNVLPGSQLLSRKSGHYKHTMPISSPIMWPTSATGHTLNPAGHRHPPLSHFFTGTYGLHINTVSPSHREHFGSAPPGDTSFLERHLGYLGGSADTHFLGAGSLGPIGAHGTDGSHCLNIVEWHDAVVSRDIFGNNKEFENNLSTSLGTVPSWPEKHMLQTGGFPVFIAGSDGFSDRGRTQRADNSIAQADNKRHYQLDINHILSGEDTRTTLMIKNIPNKYTSKMLLAAIDENHRGMYDFLYLPIDFKNKCNVGYAFINMAAPQHIIPFYEAFNGKKWEKFNSEKVASLAYARIQGKNALIAHFQNSSLMNEDKRCRPILFISDGPEPGDQGSFPLGVDIGGSMNRDQNVNADDLENSTGNNKDEPTSGSVDLAE